jgi:hypothetical protein
MKWLFDCWPDGLMDREVAERLLAPYSQRLCECWFGAWTDWKTEVSEGGRARLTPTTRAGVIHNFAISRVKAILAGEGGIEICEKLGFFKFYVATDDQMAVVRFKRLGRDRLARNVRTKQQKLWYSHKPIDGVRDGATRLTVGYTLDLTQTKIEDILVTLQFRKDIVWYFSIDDGTSQIMQRPIEPIDQQGPRVRPADDRKSKTEA